MINESAKLQKESARRGEPPTFLRKITIVGAPHRWRDEFFAISSNKSEVEKMKMIQRILVWRISLAAVMLLTAAGARAGGPWYVATNGADTGNDGLSWDQPFATISNAIARAGAVANETIWVSNGVYTITAMLDNSVVAKAYKIRALSTNPAETVLLGPGSNATTHATGGFRGVYMNGSGSTLEGFTVTNFYNTNDVYSAGVLCYAGVVSNCIIAGNIQGYPGKSGAGAGVYLRDSAVVENCTIVGNVIHPGADGSGGGVYIYNTGCRIKNCRIVDNRSTRYGGGVLMSGNGSIIQDSIIASNYGGGEVGGIYLSGGIISNCQVFANNGNNVGGIAAYYSETICYIMQCVISNNYGTVVAGGIYINYMTNVLISGCAIVNNRTTWGTPGGLFVEKNTRNVLIQNCLVANNLGESTRSDQYGGFGGAGMEIFATNTLIENCTITSNAITTTTAARNLGAGLYVTNGVRVVNSIIYHNRVAAGVSSNVYAASVDCTFSNCCTAPLSAVVGTANMDANPQFVSKDAGNYRLSTRSPCVNTGTNQGWMTDAVDIEGRKRLRYGTVDMGAYERIYDGSIYTVH